MQNRSPFKPVVVAPTFNNAATLARVLDRVITTGLPVFVVNDGSTDDTPQLLAAYANGDTVHVLTHICNRGKAAAMQTGFAAARDAGYTHAVTIDTDGQLDPEQIPDLVSRARDNPTALVIGVRDDHKADYPSRSRLGRRVSNHLVRLESGVHVNDSQCGLRVYPLGFVHAIRCRAQRFGYETEVITRAGWAGCPVVEVPVECRYLPPGERVSHFRPFVDSVRAVMMHGRLVGRALSPMPHAKWPARPVRWLPTWGGIVRWVSLKEAWRQLRHEESGHTMFATGLALGVFIANLPVYGIQTVLTLYASRRLHLHPAPAVLGSQISTPPIGIAMIAMAVYVGHVLLYGELPVWPQGGWTTASLLAAAPSLLWSWLLGSLIVGLVMASVTFMLALMLVRAMRQRSATASPASDVEA